MTEKLKKLLLEAIDGSAELINQFSTYYRYLCVTGRVPSKREYIERLDYLKTSVMNNEEIPMDTIAEVATTFYSCRLAIFGMKGFLRPVITLALPRPTLREKEEYIENHCRSIYDFKRLTSGEIWTALHIISPDEARQALNYSADGFDILFEAFQKDDYSSFKDAIAASDITDNAPISMYLIYSIIKRQTMEVFRIVKRNPSAFFNPKLDDDFDGIFPGWKEHWTLFNSITHTAACTEDDLCRLRDLNYSILRSGRDFVVACADVFYLTNKKRKSLLQFTGKLNFLFNEADLILPNYYENEDLFDAAGNLYPVAFDIVVRTLQSKMLASADSGHEDLGSPSDTPILKLGLANFILDHTAGTKQYRSAIELLYNYLTGSLLPEIQKEINPDKLIANSVHIYREQTTLNDFAFLLSCQLNEDETPNSQPYLHWNFRFATDFRPLYYALFKIPIGDKEHSEVGSLPKWALNMIDGASAPTRLKKLSDNTKVDSFLKKREAWERLLSDISKIAVRGEP